MMQDFAYYRDLRSGARRIEPARKATPRSAPRQSQLRPAKQVIRYNRKEATWLEPISHVAAVGPTADF
jgi:hypothetical protein